MFDWLLNSRGSFGLGVIVLVVALFIALLLQGCSTLIVADTPCGRVIYDSTKDQAAPAAACTMEQRPDGSQRYTLEIGAEASSGSAKTADAISRIVGALIGGAK